VIQKEEFTAREDIFYRIIGPFVITKKKYLQKISRIIGKLCFGFHVNKIINKNEPTDRNL